MPEASTAWSVSQRKGSNEKRPTITVKYPEIEVQLSGTDGNAFAIIGAVSRALRRADVSKDEVDAFRIECMSGDYDHLLQTAMKWVEVR